MEYIAEAMHASIDLTRSTCQDSNVDIPTDSRPSSSSSTTPPPSSTIYQPHPGLDTNLTIFYRPVYHGNVEHQQHQPVVYTPSAQYPPTMERVPEQGTSTETEHHYDAQITNGMRVMHFMDHHPAADVFHQYTHLYLPDQYPSGYHPSPGPISADLYTSVQSSTSFSPVVIVPPTGLSSNNNTSQNHSVGFQPYQSQQNQSSVNVAESVDLKRIIVPGEQQRAPKRKNSSDNSTACEDLTVETVEDDDIPGCYVCGDVSSGVHYGVVACEGCKGFFRRAMLKKSDDPSFVCFHGSNCDITRENRNGCRACRLRRCIEAGMVFGSRPEGKAALRKRRQLDELHEDPPIVTAHRPSSLLDVKHWTGYVLAAHTASFTPVSDVFVSKYAAVLSLAPDQLWPPGSDLSKRGFQAIQHFAHTLPFISFLPPDVRTHLLETNALDVMILRVTFRFCPERDAFLFPPGAEVTLPCLSATLLGSAAANRLAFLGKMLIRLGLASEELAFLSTLALLSPDALSGGILPGHLAMLRDFESKVLQAFYSHMKQRWIARPYLVGKLIAFLSDIRALQSSIPLQAWLEPTGSSSLNT